MLVEVPVIARSLPFQVLAHSAGEDNRQSARTDNDRSARSSVGDVEHLSERSGTWLRRAGSSRDRRGATKTNLPEEGRLQ